MKRIRLLWFFYVLLLPAVVSAQATCPANVLLAQSRARSACATLDLNQACYGSGQVDAQAQPGSTIHLDQPGKIENLALLRQVTTDSAAGWSVLLLDLQANLAGTEGRSAFALLFGDTEIANLVPPLPEITVTATGTVNIRRTPNGEIVDQIGVRGTLTANGRSGDWLRVYIPNSGELGWISSQTVSGSFANLNLVDPNAPFYRPFQTFTLYTGHGDAPCAGAPSSGMLLQTPPTTPVNFIINGTILRLSGTAFLQTNSTSGGTFTVNLLEGESEIEAAGTTIFIPAGARVVLNTDSTLSPAEPFDPEDVGALPLNNLPFRLRAIPNPLSQGEISRLTAAHNLSLATPVPTEPSEDNSCHQHYAPR